MKKLSVLCCSVVLLLTLNSCQKKDLDLKLVETACKKFKISSPTYSWITDPSCGGTSVNAAFSVTFNYDADKSCIDHIVLSPKFYRSDNTEIPNITYSSTLMKTDPDVNIGSGSITYIFRFTFANTSDADALNAILMSFYLANDVDNQSNKLGFRVNAGCSTVSKSTYNVKSTVNVSSSSVQVTLYDDASEDGDIVSVYLNGVWVLENYTLTKAGKTFTFNVNSGSNDLVLFAVNQGSSGPNTAAISINGGTHISLQPDLMTGEAVNISF